MREYLVRIFFLLLVLFELSNAQGPKISVAISEFKNSTGLYSNESMCSAIPEILKTELAQLGDLVIVERSKINAALSEQALSQTGTVDTANTQQVGQLLGAEFIITGELSFIGDRLRIDSHITRVESGEIFAEKVTGPGKGAIENMVRLLAFNINYNLVGEGGHKEQEKIRNFYPKIVIGTGISAGILSALFHNSYNNNLEKYNATTRIDEFEKFYNDSNNSMIARNVSLGVSIALISSGIALWIYQNSQANTLLAKSNSSAYAFVPCYFKESGAFGVQFLVLK